MLTNTIESDRNIICSYIKNKEIDRFSYYFNAVKYTDYEIYMNCAVVYNSLDILKFIVRMGGISSNYQIIIEFATSKKYNEIVDYISSLKDETNPESINNKLCSAIMKNDFDTVKNIIEMGVDLCYDGYKPFLCAVKCNNDDIIKYIVSKGGIKNDNGICIHYALRVCNLDILKYLIDNGANLNYDYRKLFGPTVRGNILRIHPLNIAVMRNDIEIVRLLLENNISIFMIGSIITIALLNKNYRLADFLVDNGFSMNSDGYTISLPADVHDHYDNASILFHSMNTRLTKYLIGKKILPVDCLSDHDTLLVHACSQGHYKLAEYLIKQGADISFSDNRAFRYAAYNGHLKIVKLLHKNGADIHAQNDNAFIYAVKGKRMNVVKKKRMNAVKEKRMNVVKYLLDNGMDINTRSSLAFKCACLTHDIGYVKFFIENGANLNDGEGIVLRSLIEKKIRENLFYTGTVTDNSLISYLLEKGANPNLKHHQSSKYMIDHIFSNLYRYSMNEEKRLVGYIMERFKEEVGNAYEEFYHIFKNKMESCTIEHFPHKMTHMSEFVTDYLKNDLYFHSMPDNSCAKHYLNSLPYYIKINIDKFYDYLAVINNFCELIDLLADYGAELTFLPQNFDKKHVLRTMTSKYIISKFCSLFSHDIENMF